tara:strand:- start:2 stop:547 length:546 start_codon:yes stop_codon:yes gene_type:complete
VFADDISDFQIEGMSVGDSLLNYMTVEEINNEIDFIYEEFNNSKSKNIAIVHFYKDLQVYDLVSIDFKTNDPKFEIAGISGIIIHEDKFDNCLRQQQSIFEEVKLTLTDVHYEEFEPYSHEGYPEGDIILHTISFFLDMNRRSNLEIICWDISEKMNIPNRLDFSLKSHELNDFLEEIYLK